MVSGMAGKSGLIVIIAVYHGVLLCARHEVTIISNS